MTNIANTAVRSASLCELGPCREPGTPAPATEPELAMLAGVPGWSSKRRRTTATAPKFVGAPPAASPAAALSAPGTISAVSCHAPTGHGVAPSRTPLFNLVTMTPGGSAWWKTGAPPELLHDLHLASKPLSRHHPEVGNETRFTAQLVAAAHNGQAPGVGGLLRWAYDQLLGGELRAFGRAFDTIEFPSFEQVEAMNRAEVTLERARLRAAGHTLVGRGCIDAKKAVLKHLATTLPDLLPDMRLGELNLLHVACIAPMPGAERAQLINLLRLAGVDVSFATEGGLTPLHCLAAQPDAALSLPALLGDGPTLPCALDVRDALGRTPLFVAYATQPENAAAIGWLQQRGASPFATDWRGRGMMHAVFYHGVHTDVLTALMLRGLLPPVRTGPRVQRPYLGSTSKTCVPSPGPLVVPQYQPGAKPV